MPTKKKEDTAVVPEPAAPAAPPIEHPTALPDPVAPPEKTDGLIRHRAELESMRKTLIAVVNGESRALRLAAAQVALDWIAFELGE